MQPYRVTCRTVPRACKASCGPASPSRTMFTAPFLGSHQAYFNPLAELNPIFRLLDSATAELVPSSSRAARHPKRSFNPRFNVREVGINYELQGELPGVEHKDLEIEFVDERTLVIRGKTVREESRGNVDQLTHSAVANTVEAKDTTADTAATHDAASDKSASYQKASVAEDEEEYVDAGAESDGVIEKGKAPHQVNPDPKTSEPTAEKSAGPEYKYWVTERSAGEFERRFAFPARVDQEAVKASLRDGILSVVVPKIIGQGARKIEIQ